MTGSFLPDGVFRSQIRFEKGDTDRFDRVEGSALLWQMQEIAGAHYEALGLGYDFILSHGCFWAVTRNELTVEIPPAPGEALWLDTWSGRFGHGLYRRYYRLQRPDGTILARGVSVWVLMDVDTRQLAADRSWLPDPIVVTQPEELAPARRVLFPPLRECRSRVVQDSEIDRNGHLNNTLYLRWADEVLPDNFARSHRLRGVWVEYKKELRRGETAQLAYTFDDRTLFLTGKSDGRDSFLMRCEYDPI